MRLNEFGGNKAAVIVYGRMNPPTLGHQLLIDSGKKLAEDSDTQFYVFPTKTNDDDNPLDFNTKIEFLEEFFPDINFVKTYDGTLFGSLRWLVEEGYTEIKMLAGSDRADHYQNIVQQYLPLINPDVKEDLSIGLKNFDVIECGKRNDDVEGIEGISATKLRQYATEELKEEFMKISPNGSEELKERFYKKTREVIDARNRIRRTNTGTT